MSALMQGTIVYRGLNSCSVGRACRVHFHCIHTLIPLLTRQNDDVWNKRDLLGQRPVSSVDTIQIAVVLTIKMYWLFPGSVGDIWIIRIQNRANKDPYTGLEVHL